MSEAGPVGFSGPGGIFRTVRKTLAKLELVGYGELHVWVCVRWFHNVFLKLTFWWLVKCLVEIMNIIKLRISPTLLRNVYLWSFPTKLSASRENLAPELPLLAINLGPKFCRQLYLDTLYTHKIFSILKYAPII